MGIPAARPLKIVTIQAQDDDGDLSEIVSGIKGHLNLTPAQIELSRQNCLYVSEKSLTGVAFLEKVVAPLLIRIGPDILRINSLQAYLGGDIEDATVAAAFLRAGQSASGKVPLRGHRGAPTPETHDHSSAAHSSGGLRSV